MSSEFGKNIKVSIFGESHGIAIGAVIEGFPAGFEIDTAELMRFMAKRAPGQSGTTPRSESDAPKFLSGVLNNVILGTPICAVIENRDTNSGDYEKLKFLPRPSHADFCAFVKYSGYADMRGGGHFSGRLTAPLCAAGGIAKQILNKQGIYIAAHLSSVGDIEDTLLNVVSVTGEELCELENKTFPVIDDEKGIEMKRLIEKTGENRDSVGGTIECCAVGLPAGLGSPMFDGVENRLSAALFGIPAVKGIEFGSGFEGARLKGSENNDSFINRNGRTETETNNHGGILGGITTGMPLVFKIALKPTPSIAMEQKTVDLLTGENIPIEIKGRHDPCVAVRAVPVAEAVLALVILDLLSENN